MKKIVFVISKWGYSGEEFLQEQEACDTAGLEITFLTSSGNKFAV